MKKTNTLKSLVLSMAVAGAASVAVVPAATQAGVSANVGVVSQYIYRGVEQTKHSSMSMGVDYENDSGFYIGAWAADVGGTRVDSGSELGYEYDVYAGYGFEVGDVSLGLGLTTYQYTGGFDTSYNEYNLSAGYGPVEVGYAGGKYEDGGVSGDSDYTDMYISADLSELVPGVSLTYGVWDPDTDVSDNATTRYEIGYGVELGSGIEGSATYIKADFEDPTANDENYFVLGVTASFDLM